MYTTDIYSFGATVPTSRILPVATPVWPILATPFGAGKVHRLALKVVFLEVGMLTAVLYGFGMKNP